MDEERKPTELHPKIEAILDELGTSDSECENHCRELFFNGEYDNVKQFRLKDLQSSYYRCLSFLASAVSVSKSPNQSNLPTILAEACEACADYKREETLRKLSAVFNSLH
ncbi:MAG: hypothetical protein CLLPBCKN_007019 [Chroococcidiopsis cubana SAG 39.79]|uniref:Uncharacterized protein n=1 Tax=Chroococcidiopsis cubana SAG 39.79 TaxID=388085 RepID=A0AB37UC17_9CYAN|nr:hypothetical protein [Chroococcidiopsis cubana]MDZ4877584.1 hypothetical protein [Chroococcidiopsis cubana SAG 39.79]PSB62142.1 hypothetical protein C7B79_19275 [Chroococcidiopsis cubana CCALA 043]RUT05340.1 hypothetical protein DSM107010_56120 [Chroococcidiopsis cubana SAG 39.79]